MSRPATIADMPSLQGTAVRWLVLLLECVLVFVTTSCLLSIFYLQHSPWTPWALWGLSVLCAAASLELDVLARGLPGKDSLDPTVHWGTRLGLLWSWAVCFAETGLVMLRSLNVRGEGLVAMLAIGAGSGSVIALLARRYIVLRLSCPDNHTRKWSSYLAPPCASAHKGNLSGRLQQRISNQSSGARLGNFVGRGTRVKALSPAILPSRASNSAVLGHLGKTLPGSLLRLRRCAIKMGIPAQTQMQLVSSHRHYRTTDGDQLVAVRSIAIMAAGERICFVHHAFCPPFSDTPTVKVQVLRGKGVRVKVARCYPFGVRLELRRSDARTSQRVVLRLQAASRGRRPSA